MSRMVAPVVTWSGTCLPFIRDKVRRIGQRLRSRSPKHREPDAEILEHDGKLKLGDDRRKAVGLFHRASRVNYPVFFFRTEIEKQGD